MQRHYDDSNDIAREKAIYRYVQALDQSDLETIATILDLAVDDTELDQAIVEVNQYIEEEENLIPLAENVDVVRSLLRKHLPSAFESSEGEDNPVTVSEVAARLKSERRVPFTDQDSNERLLTVSHPLPAWLSMQAINQLAAELNIMASERYWRVFRDAAIMLGMGRSHQSQLLAAREEQQRNDARRPRNKYSKKANADTEGGE